MIMKKVAVMKKTLNSKLILRLGLMLLVMQLFYLSSYAFEIPAGDQHRQVLQQAGNSYKANLLVKGPVKGTGGERLNLSLTFTELSSVSKLGSVTVKLPDLHGPRGFSDYRINPTGSTASNDKKWKGQLVERSGQFFINLRAQTSADYLVRDEKVTVSFSASVPARGNTGSYEFKTRAWSDNSSRDSRRISPETGQADNVNAMASGYSDPVIYVELPQKSGSSGYHFSNSRAKGITAELHAEGTGFQTTVFTTTDSVSFLTRLRLPALHTYTTIYYQPGENDSWHSTKIAENKTVDLLQGYAAGWKSYYHRVISPGKIEAFSSLSTLLREQSEFRDQDLSGLTNSELRRLAHQEGVAYYHTELAAQTEQFWFAGVALDQGAEGVLIKRIESSYGTTDYIFNDNDQLWPARKGYDGPAYGFGFVRDGDGYRVERGIDYPGSYIDIEQVADASRGKVIRYIDLSSPYSKSLLMEEMMVSGSGKVDEILSSVDVRPGAFLGWPGSVSFSDDWDRWVSADRVLYSAAFDSPFFDIEDDSGAAPAAHPGAEEAAFAGEAEEPSVFLPPGNSVAAGEDDQAELDEEHASTEPANNEVFEYSSDLYQGLNRTPLVILSVIAVIILTAIIVILIILIRKR